MELGMQHILEIITFFSSLVTVVEKIYSFSALLSRISFSFCLLYRVTLFNIRALSLSLFNSTQLVLFTQLSLSTSIILFLSAQTIQFINYCSFLQLVAVLFIATMHKLADRMAFAKQIDCMQSKVKFFIFIFSKDCRSLNACSLQNKLKEKTFYFFFFFFSSLLFRMTKHYGVRHQLIASSP